MSLFILLFCYWFLPIFYTVVDSEHSFFVRAMCILSALVLVVLFIFSTKMWRCTTVTEINRTHFNFVVIYLWGRPSIRSIAISDIVCISYNDAHSERCLILLNEDEFSQITEKAIEFLKQKFQIPDKRKQILKSP